MLGVLISIACWVIFGTLCYTIGHEDGFVDGRKHTIHALFYGEEDFRCYLEYRRKQIESEDDFWGSHEG